MTDPKRHNGVTANDNGEDSQPISKWVAADSYNLDAFDQIEGSWPIGHPLPLPKWTTKLKKPYIVEKVN